MVWLSSRESWDQTPSESEFLEIHVQKKISWALPGRKNKNIFIPDTRQYLNTRIRKAFNVQTTDSRLPSKDFSSVCVKFLIQTWPAWELRLEPSYFQRKAVPTAGYVDWDDK